MDSCKRIIDQVNRIAALEKEHAFFGVSFKTKDNTKSLQTDEQVLTHVINVLEAVKELDEHPELFVSH